MVFDLDNFRNVIKDKKPFFYPPLVFTYLLDKSNSYIDAIWCLGALITGFVVLEEIDYFSNKIALTSKVKKLIKKEKSTKNVFKLVLNEITTELLKSPKRVFMLALMFSGFIITYIVAIFKLFSLWNETNFVLAFLLGVLGLAIILNTIVHWRRVR